MMCHLLFFGKSKWHKNMTIWSINLRIIITWIVKKMLIFHNINDMRLCSQSIVNIVSDMVTVYVEFRVKYDISPQVNIYVLCLRFYDVCICMCLNSRWMNKLALDVILKCSNYLRKKTHIGTWITVIIIIIIQHEWDRKKR